MIHSVGLIGCGKIGHCLLHVLSEPGSPCISFIRIPEGKTAEYSAGVPVIHDFDREKYEKTDLIIECADAEALKQQGETALQYADLMPFSLTALADETFFHKLSAAAQKAGHHIYIPHGAVAGIDGIRGGRTQLQAVQIETVKNPKTLGRSDSVRTVVYKGSTREACRLYPRNVNIHAAAALAGLGFDKTMSVIVSDPHVQTNSHDLMISGNGFEFHVHITSQAGGGVSGAYTLLSAACSLKDVVGSGSVFCFI